MKVLKYIGMFAVVAMLILVTSCEEDARNPGFANDELPRIFGWSTVNKYFLDVSDSLILDLKISPADGATYKWFINGEEGKERKGNK
jgi:hypothetical protein